MYKSKLSNRLSLLLRPLLYCLVILELMCFSSVTSATNYSNSINSSSWQLARSVHRCELSHRVPFYGEAVFRKRAGEASAFYLRAKSSRFQAGEAELTAKSPLWASEPKVERLGRVAIKRGTRPMWLSSLMTEKMLARLNAGYEIEISRELWYESGENPPSQLSISNIGFREAYDDYLVCLSSLLPANFDQLRRTALQFPAGEVDELPRALTSKLDKVLKLVKHDEKIRAFFIDGHTDSEGDRDENLELSKVRAEMVTQYLQRRGIPEDWITLRWHGERYPTASNRNAKGRARNRRVTLRMERIEEIEVLPLAANP
ncbi:MAG: outer membrane protein OmpA-like peptidoglycan-associated protein [Flavobacteriales bacterium]|jgi:outer membrane protein OmpA-like peptidoglycan-associated protein